MNFLFRYFCVTMKCCCNSNSAQYLRGTADSDNWHFHLPEKTMVRSYHLLDTCFNIILGSNFLSVSNSNHTLILKYQITKAKRKICFKGFFKFIILFFYLQTWQQKISQRQPQSQTNRYQVLSCQ